MSGLACRGVSETAWDDVSKAELKPDLVKSARDVEMEVFDKLEVY